MSKPKKSDNCTTGCKCDHCGKALHAKHIWWWEEHLGCSKPCVEAEYYKARPELVEKKDDEAEADQKGDSISTSPAPVSTVA